MLPPARRPAGAALALAALLATSLTSCATGPSAEELRERAACAVDALSAADGVAFGVDLDWEEQTVAEYADLLGEHPADVVSYAPIPWREEDRAHVLDAAKQAADAGAAQLLTLEPSDGLTAVTDEAVSDLVETLVDVTELGVPVLVRFGHEMNGSWYPWGQQPEAYVTAFRRVATAVHADVPGAAMMWAPNYGGGYPFPGRAYSYAPDSAQASALDTDGDGAVTDADDPYAPYYPGDEAVDWVGISLTHWGSSYPWGENETPEADKFAAQLTGAYDGLAGDETAVPDFYREYAERRNRPLAIPSTAALVTGDDDEAGQEIRRVWREQVFSEETRQDFPLLRLVNWFEWERFEPEADAIVHWAALADEEERRLFRADVPEWVSFGGGGDGCR
ncbi:hypothetical protein GCM10022219_25410 [Microbacterium oryzae]|uniref:GH26 domain-containing protein n=1 Tax=Microbacterium oryzae TaxID=743009 RepID=A0A6I6E324_9MICO|nr:glycosyl hydrolase [Microbacterium oryzae]QGU27157.1 hypothetical protein D7D94_05370 [Microbacterium oryzae]